MHPASSNSICCPTSVSSAELSRSASCLLTAQRNGAVTFEPQCEHNETSAGRVLVLGAHCINATGGSRSRGFFVQSRTSRGMVVCTGGDIYRVHVESDPNLLSLYSSFGTPVGDSNTSALYFINTDAGTMLPGQHTYKITLTLQETQRRALERQEGVGITRWSATGTASPIREWVRYRECLDTIVRLPDAARSVMVTGPPMPASEAQCGAVAPSTPTALVALSTNNSCEWRCTGDGNERLLKRIPLWANPKEHVNRSRVGYRHVLKPEGVRCRVYRTPALIVIGSATDCTIQ